MAAEAAAGTVTIWERGRQGLYADDLGLTVRHPVSGSQRFAWSEVGRLADGGRPRAIGELPDQWELLIVPHKGESVEVRCAGPTGSATPEVVMAIRQVAKRYGIPADVTGVPMKDGKPLSSGLFEDPWGQPGLRYWDGTRWSPLLPLDVIKHPYPRKSAATWISLPAEGPWTYPASRARRWTRWTIVWAVASAALLTIGLAIQLWWDREPHKHVSSTAWFFVTASFAWFPLLAWHQRRYLLKLDAAARRSAEVGGGAQHEFFQSSDTQPRA